MLAYTAGDDALSPTEDACRAALSLSSGQLYPEDGERSGTRQMILECHLPEAGVCDVEITLADSEAIRPGEPPGSAYEEV
jgi:hypothetical protein